MTATFLITSFDTWLPHQRSNASDDLLTELLNENALPKDSHLLRKLPVDFQQAPALVIDQMNQVQPDFILCCGMAETRQQLTVELNGKGSPGILQTAIDLEALIENLAVTAISQDAGQFVCNHLYYSILHYINDQLLNSKALFIHVPPLNPANLSAIKTDFVRMIDRLAASKKQAMMNPLLS